MFTQREGEIIEESMKGLLVKEIANNLCISFYTADSHIKNAKKRSGAKNMAQLVFLYMKDHKDLLLTVMFVMIQSFTIVNNLNIDQRKRKTARKVQRERREMKAKTIAIA